MPQSRPPQAANDEAPEVVLVLGAATAAPGVPGPALRRRLEHGCAVLRACGAGHLLVSGGIVGPPPAEAQVMRDLAIGLGIEPVRIVVEDQARNTFENAVYSGRIIRERGWRRVVLVTDRFHVPRARYVFARLGLPVTIAAVPPEPGTSPLSRLRSRFDEGLRLARSVLLFAIGAHKPLLSRVWGDTAPLPPSTAAQPPGDDASPSS